MNFVFRYLHATFLLVLVPYGLNAMDMVVKFDNLEQLDNHLQQITSPPLYNFNVGGYVFSGSSFYGACKFKACDLWASKNGPKYSAAKLLRWNVSGQEHNNETKPHSNQNRNNKATDLIHSIVLPAQKDKPGFFTVGPLFIEWQMLFYHRENRPPFQTYKKNGPVAWEKRNWFTVDTVEGTVVETATVYYKPREAQNFTSLEVTVTEDDPIDVKTIQTLINKTTCASLLACAAGAWAAFSYFKGK